MRKRRRSIRLRQYDYAQPGAYFVTLCTHARECLFGEIVSGEMRLNIYGEIVAEEWKRSAEIRHEVELDVFVVMPNHLHGIVAITDDSSAMATTRIENGGVGAHGRVPLRRPPRSLGSFIAGFKSAVTKRINELRNTPGLAVWQRNYHERIIRDDAELVRVREYVLRNPTHWTEDDYNLI